MHPTTAGFLHHLTARPPLLLDMNIRLPPSQFRGANITRVKGLASRCRTVSSSLDSPRPHSTLAVSLPRPQTIRQRFPAATMRSPSDRHYSAASPATTAATKKPPSPVRPSARSVVTTTPTSHDTSVSSMLTPMTLKHPPPLAHQPSSAPPPRTILVVLCLSPRLSRREPLRLSRG